MYLLFPFQKLFVITAFNENLVDAAVSHIHRIPWIGPKLDAPFKELLIKQKEKLHRKVGVVDSAVSSVDVGADALSSNPDLAEEAVTETLF